MQTEKLIVAIDDDPDMAALYRLAFVQAGFQCLSFISPTEFLKHVDDSGTIPAVVLCDLLMPQMSGTELVHKLRSDPRFSATRIFLSSGAVDLPGRAKDAGADGALQKPVSIATLISTVAGTR